MLTILFSQFYWHHGSDVIQHAHDTNAFGALVEHLSLNQFRQRYIFFEDNLLVENLSFKINTRDYQLQHLKFIFFQSYVIEQRQHLR